MTKYTIYFDGASRGNPGNASYGFVVYVEVNDDVNVKFFSQSGFLGKQTNNYAEYKGLLEALKFIDSISSEDDTQIEIKGDSLLVINQVKGVWMTREPNLKLLNTEIIKILSKYSKVKLEHIDRSRNKEADALCNEVFLRV
jgi:ribonuclease HI